jgi:hypothetical protein
VSWGIKGFEVRARHRVPVTLGKPPDANTFLGIENYGASPAWLTINVGDCKADVRLAPDERFFLPPFVAEKASFSVTAGDRAAFVRVGFMSFPREAGAPPLAPDADPIALHAEAKAKDVLDTESLVAALPILHALDVAQGKASPADVVMRAGLSLRQFSEFLGALKGLKSGGHLVFRDDA